MRPLVFLGRFWLVAFLGRAIPQVGLIIFWGRGGHPRPPGRGTTPPIYIITEGVQGAEVGKGFFVETTVLIIQQFSAYLLLWDMILEFF